MSEQTSQEPTMEEILASIRRIISEDDQPAEGAAEPAAAPAVEAEPEPAPAPAAAAAPAPEPEPVVAEAPAPAPPPVAAPEPEPDVAEEEDALELTQRVETHGDLDVVEATPAPVPPPPAVEPAPTLVSPQAAVAAAASFGALSAAIAMPREGRTLEDVVREMLQPLLKQWLDENLPRIVQEQVQAEVERIARGRVG